MPLSLPKAVIFDWDNTLVDSWGAIGESINYVRARYGASVWTPSEIIANCTRSARESFPEWFGDRWQDAWQDYYVYFEKVRARMGVHPMPGAQELLVELKKRNIPAVVVSNKSGGYLRQEVDLLKWNDYFLSIVGAHDSPKDKPAREHADHALQLAGLKADKNVWFIGDSEADIQCARNAGCTPILIGNTEIAKRHKIDIFVSNCLDLVGLLSATHP